MRIDQAVFTSIKGSRLDGYQLAAHSPGVTASLISELTAWGPAHDSLIDTAPGARSINFHPLSTGFCGLSCTTLAGAEYSGRAGGRVYTQMFVLPTEALARFDHDPFLVLRALAAAGRLVVYDAVPETLPTVSLLGRAEKPVDVLVHNVSEEVGRERFDELREAVKSQSQVVVLLGDDAHNHLEHVFQAVLHSFPSSDRLPLSFTTGLKPSPRRPFKLGVLPTDPTTVRQTKRQNGIKLVDLSVDPAPLGK